ncbi:PREDICTED: beta-casein, partial [Hipposideros armiger]|uniref:Beta-casein n=1 Tax=Hipposideros armiger TaxID=186990 RepID=A0A8B7T3R1_HIPAR
MKVLILACLVALALAKETVESLSNSEESISHINKKPEKSEQEKQQQREDERQDKTQPFVQPQPLVYPYAEPIPYAILPQNVLPLAQPAVVLPYLQPEIMEVLKAKETTFPKRKVMPFFERQIPNLPHVKTPHFPLPLLQPVMHQVPQPVFQAPMLPTQPLLPFTQPKVQPLPQQMMAYPQGDIPAQALQYQETLLDPAHQFYPVAQPLAPVFNLQQ